MRYLLRVRYHATGDEAAMNFPTALARAIEIIALTPYAEILTVEDCDGLDDRGSEPPQREAWPGGEAVEVPE